MRSLFKIALITLALAVAAPVLAQQITTGTITGITKDEQGLVLPGANVELLNEETGDVRIERRRRAEFSRHTLGPLHPESEP